MGVLPSLWNSGGSPLMVYTYGLLTQDPGGRAVIATPLINALNISHFPSKQSYWHFVSPGFQKNIFKISPHSGWYLKLPQFGDILGKSWKKIYFESVWLQITLVRLQTQTTLKEMC